MKTQKNPKTAGLISFSPHCPEFPHHPRFLVVDHPPICSSPVLVQEDSSMTNIMAAVVHQLRSQEQETNATAQQKYYLPKNIGTYRCISANTMSPVSKSPILAQPSNNELNIISSTGRRRIRASFATSKALRKFPSLQNPFTNVENVMISGMMPGGRQGGPPRRK